MARFCTNCGKEISEDAAFCTECGTPLAKETSAAQPVAAQEPETAATQVATMPPQPAVAEPSPPVYPAQNVPQPDKSGVISTGYFFGMMLLYSVPVLGWLVCVVMSLAAKNQSKKNFAKAILIWLGIGLVLSVISYIVFRWLGGRLTDYINTEFGGQFGSLIDFLKQFK